MNRSKMVLAAIALSTLLAGTTSAVMAFGGHHPDGPRGCHRGEMSAPQGISRLENFSEEQQSELQNIRKETRDAMRALRDEMIDTREALQQAMQQGTDMEAINALAQKKGEQTTRMIMLRAESQNRVRAVLTDEQREQLQNSTLSDDGFDQPFGPRHYF